ncbi:hypothetical protein D3H55_04865 [Bacillus salacetis]|uniref:Uncharacterized protein n=1 Tax=Bacillus salacetis TaxID=2315464 RepID=A0A3A1R3S0_9BACI|nr:CBO0543 family protein [Bacillus salacetis]RIW37368.1 hypothetical protein D3H55_04865 [Bacillus salacetis]
MQTSFLLFFIILGLIFGDWKNWKDYYPTLLFWIIGDLLYESLLSDYRVWEFKPVWIDRFILPTHTLIATGIAFLAYPFAIVIFLGRMPKSMLHRIFWIILWALLFECVEIVAYLGDSIKHHHGWSLLWSLLFNLATFSILMLHKWKPWTAWLSSMFIIAVLFIVFDVPLPD